MRALLFIFPWLLFNARSGCSLHGMIWFVFNIGLTWPSVASECAFKGDTPERFYDWQGEVVSLLNVSVQSACFMRTYQQMAQYARQITKVPHKRRLHWSSFDFFHFPCWNGLYAESTLTCLIGVLGRESDFVWPHSISLMVCLLLLSLSFTWPIYHI